MKSKSTRNEFGKRLKEARKRNGLYLHDIQRLFGILPEHFFKLEIGSLIPTLTEREELEKFIHGEEVNVEKLTHSIAEKVAPLHSFSAEDQKEYHALWQAVIATLDDERDKKLYRKLIDYRLNSKQAFTFLQYTRPPHEAYFEHLCTDTIKTVIEGGVADGFFTRKYQRFASHIYGFEPFISSFETSRYRKEMDERVQVLPVALWSCRSKMNFHMNHIDSHCSKLVCDNSGEEIETISIDEFARENNLTVDLIKLDIEGAEMDVLRGAEKTIVENKPHLTISIYHYPCHMFEIPLWLRERLPRHRFKIGHYSKGITETILYCIPPQSG
jgi:FkbM family methyltransferase